MIMMMLTVMIILMMMVVVMVTVTVKVLQHFCLLNSLTFADPIRAYKICMNEETCKTCFETLKLFIQPYTNTTISTLEALIFTHARLHAHTYVRIHTHKRTHT